MSLSLACPLCESPLSPQPALRAEGVGLHVCPRCEHMASELLLRLRGGEALGNAAAAVYGRGYFTAEGADGSDFESALPTFRAEARERLRLLERYRRPPGRLLEVGCSLGYFLAEAAASGWQVTGVDVSDYAVARAQELAPSARLLRGDLLDLDLEPGSFAAISSFHTLEHVVDPRGAVERARELLVPGGVLQLEVPCVRDVAVRAERVDEAAFKVREHLSHFNRRSLCALLESVGLQRLHLRRVGGGYGRGALAITPTGTERPAGRLDRLRERAFAARRLVYAVPGARRVVRRLYWDWLGQGGALHGLWRRT